MSELYKHRIRRFRKDILNDIQEDVIEELVKLNVVTNMDIQNLNQNTNQKEKMEEFLNIILNKSPSDVDLFIKSLKIWYSWLYDLIVNPNNNIYSLTPILEDLARGGVPPLPPRNITRTSLVDRVRGKLMDLNRNQYLVLHGMLGCGKTSLATEAINCDAIRDLCRGNVFWISVGSEGDKNIPALQQMLNSYLPQPEPTLADDINVALIRLRLRFSEWEEGKDALIVLDDVHSEKVVECLSVGTKFLITTEDENIISGHRISITMFEKVPDGFEEQETLSLLAAGVGIKPHELPSQARIIHKSSKGHPMIVSLISAQLEDHKEQVQANSSRWDYYTKLFSDKKLKRRSLDESQYLNNAIKISLESMDEKMIGYFKHFVIFVEDVNITPEVLATMWSMDKHEVENLMMEFVRKSLVVRKWNKELKSYVYGIHDLLLRYLINHLDKEYIKSLHRNFIESYMRVCNSDLSKLSIEDNYIFYYIGRHLKLAKMFELFPMLYFNLEFLEMKVRKAGPADVLMDFKRYKDCITGHKELKNIEKLTYFRQLVELYGSWIHKGLDIAQLALQESSHTSVYKCALDLAKKRSKNHSYVLFPLGPHNKKRIVPQMVNIKKDISCVCFTDSPHFVLVGTYQGNIDLWDLRSKLIKRKYNEHTGYISKLKVDSTYNNFLSSSTDGLVKVWSLVTDALSGDRSPSPRERQNNYSEFWPSSMENLGEKSYKTLQHDGPVLWATFPQLPSSDVMATVSHPDVVTIWNGNIKRWHLEESGAKSCELCNRDQWVVVGGEERVSIFGITSSILIHRFNTKANFLYAIPDNLGGGLLMVSDDRVDVWGYANVQPSIVQSEISPTEKYTKCALNYHIALGTNMNNVRVCHRHTGKTLARFSESRIEAELVDVTLTEGALITAFNDKTLFLWPLDDVVLPVSTISWPTNDNIPFIARVTHGNAIQICKGREIKSEIPIDGEVLNLELSPDAKFIGFTTANNPAIQVMEVGRNEIMKCDIRLQFPLKLSIFTYQEKAIVAAYKDFSKVHVWFQLTNQLIILDEQSTNCKFISMASNENPYLITVSSLHGVHVWNLENGLINRTLARNKIQRIETFSLSYNKEVIALSESNVVRLINTETSAVLLDIEDLALITYCTLSPNGKILAYALRTNSLVVYNTTTKEVRTHSFVKKNGNDLMMAVTDNGTLCVATTEPLLAIFTNRGTSYIVLHVSSIISSPNNSDIFAALDNCGESHILQITNGCDL